MTLPKRLLAAIPAFLFAAAALAGGKAAPKEQPRQRYLVKFTAAATASAPSTAALLAKLGLPPDKASLAEPPVTKLAGGSGLRHWLFLETPARPDATAFLDSLRRDAAVEFAEPDYDSGPGTPPVQEPGPTPPPFPDDPLYPAQLHLKTIHCDDAWKITTGSPAVKVAVLDTGCNTALPDFAGRTVPGHDFLLDSSTTEDSAGHGTSVAAILGATGDNGVGAAGVDWRCRLMPVRMVTGGAAAYAQGIELAVRSGCKVINLSGKFEAPNGSRAVAEALRDAEAAGVVVVASAGNQNRDGLAYPASFPTVVAVAALGPDNASRWVDPQRGEGSNLGDKLAVCAPGSLVVTLSKNGKRAFGSGTSAATAMVSGACSLMLAVNPKLTPKDIRRILQDSADRVGGPYVDGYSRELGHGRLNVLQAVRQAQAEARP